MSTPAKMTMLHVQHDDAFVDDVLPHPYHTRYFDVVTTIPPGLGVQNHQSSVIEPGSVQEPPLFAYQNLDSITSYEDAIIISIASLRDFKIGSTISSIKNYMKNNFIQDIYPQYYNQNQFYSINNTLFLVAMKSLLNKNIIEASCVKNGTSMSCFQLSQKFLEDRFRTVRKQRDIQMREEAQRVREVKFHRQGKKMIIVPAHAKHPLSKQRLFDPNGGIIAEDDNKVHQIENSNQMEMDKKKQRRFSYLTKIQSNRNSTVMFITKRRKLGIGAKIPSNRIVVTNK